MEKRTLYAAVSFAILGILAYSVMRAPDKGEHRGPAVRPFPVVKSTDLAHIEITTQKDEKTTLEKKDGVFRVTSPGDWPADAQAMKTLTDALEKLSFADIVTEDPAKQQQMQVADKGSAHIKLVGKGIDVEFMIGQSISGFAMLRIAGKNEVWQANGLPLYVINKAPKDWRDHSVVTLTATEIDKITSEVPGGSTITVERAETAKGDGKAATPAMWKIKNSSGDAAQGTDFDNSQPQTVAQAIASLRAFDFADGKSAKDAGLEPPLLIVTVGAKGKEQSVEIGAQQGEDFFVRRKGEATIFMVKKYLLDRAAARPVDYRDKTLLHVKADDVSKIDVVQGKDQLTIAYKDGKWTAPGVANLDENKAKAIVGGVESLFGTSFVTDKSLKTELDKPRATVTVEPKSGAKVTLKVGGLTTSNAEYFVAIEGKKDVMVAKKFAIDRLLKKPADMGPTPKPTALPKNMPMPARHP